MGAGPDSRAAAGNRSLMTPEPVLDARGRSYWRELGLGVSGDAVGRGTEKNPASLGQICAGEPRIGLYS